jgi:hypothetical protein
MYAVGNVIYVDMNRYQRAKHRLCLRDKNGKELNPQYGVCKELICATKELSNRAYEEWNNHD